jgi:putative restriction endonuclease
MFWLEMSSGPIHGGGQWGFGHSLWAPTQKRLGRDSIGGKWLYWENLLRVQPGDFVFHFRYDKGAVITGYSTAEASGAKTSECPPEAGQWGYDQYYYRVPLKEYFLFREPIDLHTTFVRQSAALRQYYEYNRSKPIGQKKGLFYVVCAGRIQFLNGAYLSEVDDELVTILLGSDPLRGAMKHALLLTSTKAGEYIARRRIRLGQKEFSQGVRENYQHCCCFPGCTVAEDRFLIAGHIACWREAPELRGKVENGLCLCRMHDTAFEQGYFTIGEDFRVRINKNNTEAQRSTWCKENILPYEGYPIRLGFVSPSRDALSYHWRRIGIQFS